MAPSLAFIRIISAAFVWVLATHSVQAEKSAYLELADQGWNYQLRTTMIGRDMSIPVRISGQTLSGAALCVVGDPPKAQSRAVIDAFRALSHRVFGKQLTMRYAGESARGCGSGKTVVLRLYSGFPPNDALSDDLAWMNEAYALGLPKNRHYAATSPAIGQTFFGRRGQSTHIMVQQPGAGVLGADDALYFRSILIEELYQAFTFGMDILHFQRNAVFLSKLQEYPFRFERVPWNSPAFRRALLHTNPVGLCAFDVFMMHAVAEAPVEQTNSDAFISYIDSHFDRLSHLAQETMADARFDGIIDNACAPYEG